MNAPAGLLGILVLGSKGNWCGYVSHSSGTRGCKVGCRGLTLAYTNLLFALCNVGVLVLLSLLLFSLEVMSNSFATPWTVAHHLLCP